MKKKKDFCDKCSDWEWIAVEIPCPQCVGHSLNELNELRRLADWVEENFKSRSKPHKKGAGVLQAVRWAQGKKGWVLYENR